MAGTGSSPRRKAASGVWSYFPSATVLGHVVLRPAARDTYRLVVEITTDWEMTRAFITNSRRCTAMPVRLG